MKEYIFYDKTQKEYFWTEDTDFFNQYIKKNPYYQYVKTAETDGKNEKYMHCCKLSKLASDWKPYTDTVQYEEELPEHTVYAVNYYKDESDDPDNNNDSVSLIRLTDLGLTKNQIVHNVKAQKYIEGAEYFPMHELKDENPEYLFIIVDRNGKGYNFGCDEEQNKTVQEKLKDPRDTTFDKDNIYGYLYHQDAVQYHRCQKSELWGDDVKNYTDELQEEEKLPEGNYIVSYYKVNSYNDLDDLIDYNISKQEIIKNVKNQKYREGAQYFKMSSLIRYPEDTEKEEAEKPAEIDTVKKQKKAKETVFVLSVTYDSFDSPARTTIKLFHDRLKARDELQKRFWEKMKPDEDAPGTPIEAKLHSDEYKIFCMDWFLETAKITEEEIN